MWGRYRLSRRKQIIAEHFDADLSDNDWVPRYNIAPTQLISDPQQQSRDPCAQLAPISTFVPFTLVEVSSIVDFVVSSAHVTSFIRLSGHLK